jgi:hypothetical protein
MDSGHFERNALCGGERFIRGKPAIDRLPEERPNLLIALKGPAVEREEEPLEVSLGRIGHVLPHAPDHLVGDLGRAASDVVQLGLGTGFDGAHDLDQKAVLGAEVVDEHAMAGSDGRGDLAEAEIPQAVGDEVVDHLSEERLFRLLALHVPNGTLVGGGPRAESARRTIGGSVAQQVIEQELTANASPATVFALLADGSTWPSWSPIDSFELVHKGAGDPEGIGAVRIFRTGRVNSRERVVTVTPNETFSYELISGLAVRDYKAVIRLMPSGEGTSIRWRSTFQGKVPGTGWIYRRQLGKFIGLTVSGLAAAAESATLGGRSGSGAGSN